MERLVQIGRDLTRASQAAFVWWTGEIASVVPARVRALLDRRAQLEAHVGPSLDIWLTTRRGKTKLGTIDPESPASSASLFRRRTSLPTILVPHGADVFAREIRVPRSALPHLKTVVQAQFEAWTPFSAAEALWMARLVRPIDERHAIIELRFILRSDLAGPAALLRKSGFVPESVALGDVSERGWRAPFGARKRSLDQRLRLAFQLAAACALGLGFAFHLVALERRKADQEERVQALSARLSPTAAVKKKLAALKAFQEQVHASTQGIEMARAIIELGNLTPAGDWFSEIEVDGRTVRVKGVTAAPDVLTRAFSRPASLQSAGPIRFEAEPGGKAHRFIQAFERR